MSETHPLIEKMARAIFESFPKESAFGVRDEWNERDESLKVFWWRQARAALVAALEGMREPSNGQVRAGLEANAPPPDETPIMLDCLDFGGENAARRLMSSSWQAMLDQLAKEVLGE